jgi:hypothetical protein
LSRGHSDENAARHFEQRVAFRSVGCSQFEHRKALFLRHPRKISAGPTTVPKGYHSIKKKPPISIASPSRVFRRAFFFVAMPCRLPGRTTAPRHSGHSALAPAAERRYGKVLPQCRHRQVRISLLKLLDAYHVRVRPSILLPQMTRQDVQLGTVFRNRAPRDLNSFLGQ